MKADDILSTEWNTSELRHVTTAPAIGPVESAKSAK